MARYRRHPACGACLVSIRSGLLRPVHSGSQAVMTFWPVSLAINQVPLFIHAFLIARGGTVKEEGQSELVRAKRYSVQQVGILIPFLVAVLALIQESYQQKKEIRS